jgi:hypothetical protein
MVALVGARLNQNRFEHNHFLAQKNNLTGFWTRGVYARRNLFNKIGVSHLLSARFKRIVDCGNHFRIPTFLATNNIVLRQPKTYGAPLPQRKAIVLKMAHWRREVAGAAFASDILMNHLATAIYSPGNFRLGDEVALINVYNFGTNVCLTNISNRTKNRILEGRRRARKLRIHAAVLDAKCRIVASRFEKSVQNALRQILYALNYERKVVFARAILFAHNGLSAPTARFVPPDEDSDLQRFVSGVRGYLRSWECNTRQLCNHPERCAGNTRCPKHDSYICGLASRELRHTARHVPRRVLDA